MSFWEAMGKFYRKTGDEKYARAWCAQLVDWTQKNPRDAEHAYAWRSIEAGIRGHHWTSLFQYFHHSPAFRYRLAKNAKEPGTRFVTVVAPYSATPPVVSARIIGQPPVGAARIEMEVVVDGVAKRIDYRLPD